ncbi:tetratricopeptide (TPR) repeat protein [Kibdelosporangium banguiense]|uniref:Tetratricopeptide (TPR) repeat protein n=1 Tax=Kibdelosporangium banguiense TaxID=1365924 RepID=A0ABS4TRQ3_9PSEU|nr:helix-turn-helix domain-containing protein [Kibdelosporangium banguiense]MBP2327093.1 tetratricopeptide (TPR) repeat protein [Kibdelosporangium banguiense]
MTSSAGIPGIDPSTVRTPADLAACLNELRKQRGLSYEQMDKAARKLQGEPGRRWDTLGKSTVAEIVTGKRLPAKGKLETFLAVCQVPPVEAALWVAAWNRVRRPRVVRPVGALRVGQALPRRLGVHAAIEVEGSTSELPDYVSRDFDQRLHAALADGSERGGFVLLVGDASVGKTRALFEAVRVTLPEWWLVYPADAGAIRDLAQAPVPRTVVWLDELLRYLGAPDPLTAATVRTLLSAGLVVVGTLWQDDYRIRIAQRDQSANDPYAPDRDVLRLAEVFDVPDEFTSAERARTEQLAVSDRRLRAAIESTDAGVTQVLAAGPELVRSWEMASDPYGKAVITAAVDARRLGVTVPLTESYLAAAVPGYITATQRAVASADWFERALAYATTPLRGAARALSPIADEAMGVVTGYVAADFLLQRARRTRRVVCPPSSTWRALCEHCCFGVEELKRLGQAAELRMRWREAIAFYRRLASDGGWESTVKLAELLAKDGCHAEAIALGEPWADSWSLGAQFADWLVKADRIDELRSRALAGEWPASNRLAQVLAKRGQLDEAIALVRPFASHENWTREGVLADLLVSRGDADELLARGQAGSRPATGRLSNLLARQGYLDQAIEVLVPYVETEPGIAERVVQLLLEQEKLDEAVAVLRRFADAGSGTAVEQIVDLLIDYGRRDEAIEYLRECAADGNWNARHRLPQYGPREQLQASAANGDRHALKLWVDLLIEEDRLDEAVEAFRSHMDTAESAGMWWLPGDLVNLLHAFGRLDDLRLEVDAGTEGAADRLAQLLDGKGSSDSFGPRPPRPPRRPRSCYRGWIIMPPH